MLFFINVVLVLFEYTIADLGAYVAEVTTASELDLVFDIARDLAVTVLQQILLEEFILALFPCQSTYTPFESQKRGSQVAVHQVIVVQYLQRIEASTQHIYSKSFPINITPSHAFS